MEQNNQIDDIFKGENPFFTQERLTKIVDILKPVLQKNNYKKIQTIPGTKSWISAPLTDIANFFTLITGNGNSILRSSVWPEFYENILKNKSPECAILYRIFHRNGYIKDKDILKVFSQNEINELVNSYLLVNENEQFFSLLKVNPVENGYFLSGVVTVTPGEFIYLGWDSYVLAKALMGTLAAKPQMNSALDLCTGSGVQAILASTHFNQVIGVDINPNSPLIASANSRLNNRDNCHFILSDLYTYVKDKFDFIIANPPYVFSTEKTDLLGYCGDGKGDYGMEIPLRIIEGWERFLNQTGEAVMITISPIVNGTDVLIYLVKEHFNSFKLSFEFHEIATHVIHKGLLEEHKKIGIEHATFYIIKAKRAPQFSLSVIQTTPLNKTLNRIAKFQTLLTNKLKANI